MMRFALLVALVSCSKAEPTKGEPDPKPGVAPSAPEIKIALAGVTLADDCADGIPTKPLAPPATPPPPAGASAGSSSQPAAPAAAAERASAGSCAYPGPCGSIPQPACEQTAMQIAVTIPAGVSATKIKIKQVELLDDAGKAIGVLAARAASKWDGKGAYVAWDEAIAGKGDLVVSYKLTAPDWIKISNGRWNATSKRFSLRVTVSISDKDRTIEKQSIVPIAPEPAVAT
ncbi:MAG: hypothetical protein H0V17_09280 [Deltaproteobacteria bacterium]|nr:hypothetical protein [Deltaproteobacteria bacterium]